MKGIIILLRLGLYGYTLYIVYFINLWIAVGFLTCFLFFEFSFMLLGFLKRSVDTIGFAQTQTDFGFSSHSLTYEEAELVDQIRIGDLMAAVIFLQGRCQNKLIDFKLLPEPVRLLLAQRLINAINRGESPTWSDLLADNTSEKKVSI